MKSEAAIRILQNQFPGRDDSRCKDCEAGTVGSFKEKQRGSVWQWESRNIKGQKSKKPWVTFRHPGGVYESEASADSWTMNHTFGTYQYKGGR
jgi:hypothetical protein